MKSIVKLKILAIILTILEFTALTIFIFFPKLSFILERYNFTLIVWLLHYLIVLIFILFIVKKMGYEKKQKNENILMLLFLGVIGMWLWLPNKEELK